MNTNTNTKGFVRLRWLLFILWYLGGGGGGGRGDGDTAVVVRAFSWTPKPGKTTATTTMNEHRIETSRSQRSRVAAIAAIATTTTTTATTTIIDDKKNHRGQYEDDDDDDDHRYNRENDFRTDVVRWLNNETISWQEYDMDHHQHHRHYKTSSFLLLHESMIVLHLCPTPTRLRECLSPASNRQLTEWVAAAQQQQQQQSAENNHHHHHHHHRNGTMINKIIHLHEDVWRDKSAIVKSRLLVQSTKRAPQRIYARKTRCHRVDAVPARSFLLENHLWGATKARYHYGLYQTFTETVVDAKNTRRSQSRRERGTIPERRLVAVATFSKCRKVQRSTVHNNNSDNNNNNNNSTTVYDSYELIRYCSLKDCTVVGGISKLLKQFIRDRRENSPRAQPMDIVTIVDRDWGAATGWEDALHFQSMSILDPLVMVVSARDKQRRYLVGAGLHHDGKEMDENIVRRQSQSRLSPRLGLSRDILIDLNATASPTEAIQILAKEELFPVYDAGVERLYMLVDPPTTATTTTTTTTQHERTAPTADEIRERAKMLWRTAVPKYTTRYYSSNNGIVSLLDYAARGGPPLDDLLHHDALQSWKTSASSSSSSSQSDVNQTNKIIFSMQSTMDPDATIQICQRDNGWRTMQFVKDPKFFKVSSIYHGIWKVHPDNNMMVESEIVIQEHLKTMTVLALMTGQMRSPTTVEDDISNILENSSRGEALRFLHFGYGAGILVRMLAYYQDHINQHTVIELDHAVVEAVRSTTPAVPNVSVITQNAVQFVHDFDSQIEKRYDCVCIDVFDENNFVPQQLYSIQILQRLRDDILSNGGIMVWNFHSGGKRRAKVVNDASEAVSAIFGNNSCCWVPSIDSTATGGNIVLLASKRTLPQDGDGNVLLSKLALQAKIKFGLTFDAAARVNRVTTIGTPFPLV